MCDYLIFFVFKNTKNENIALCVFCTLVEVLDKTDMVGNHRGIDVRI